MKRNEHCLSLHLSLSLSSEENTVFLCLILLIRDRLVRSVIRLTLLFLLQCQHELCIVEFACCWPFSPRTSRHVDPVPLACCCCRTQCPSTIFSRFSAKAWPWCAAYSVCREICSPSSFASELSANEQSISNARCSISTSWRYPY